MEPKKHASRDVHRYRPVIFSTGLIFSLLIVIVAFHWKAAIKAEKPRYVADEINEPEFIVRPTVQPPRERPATVLPMRTTASVQITEAAIGDISLPAPDIYLDSIEAATIEIPADEPLEVLDWTDEMPEPEGGYEAFYALLRSEMNYPRKARATETEGRVFVRFTVGKDGTLRDFSVVKGIGAGCDEEALRVLRLTHWRAGRQNGRPVAVRMIQPIFFKLGTR